MEKKYCETHHLYYTGIVCPLCQSEKYDKMMEKYGKKDHKVKNETDTVSKDKPLTEDVLNKLKNHFNQHNL